MMQLLREHYKVVSVIMLITGIVSVGLGVFAIVKIGATMWPIIGTVTGAIIAIFGAFTLVKGVH